MASSDLSTAGYQDMPLRSTEALVRGFLDAAPMMMGLVEVVDSDLRYLSCNAAAAAFFGLTPETMRGRLASEMGTPESVIRDWVHFYRESARTAERVRFSYEVHRPDGTRWLSATVAPAPAPPGAAPRFAFIVEDVTERHPIEEAARLLAEPPERPAAANNVVVDDITDVFFAVDLDWKFTYANRQAERTFLRPREEFIGQNVWAVFPRAVGTLFETECRRAMQEQVTVRFEEYAPSYDAWFEAHVYPSPDGLSVFMSNITERKRAEERLQELTQRLEFHVQNSPFGAVEFSADMRITRFSEEAERVFGWAADEVLGKSIWEVPWIHPEDLDKVAAVMASMASGERRRIVNPNRNLRKDGSVIWCVWYNSALLDAQGRMTSCLALVHDVTAQREAQLEQERLLGELESEREHLQRALQALSESRDQYRRMGDTIPYGVWRCDAQGRAVYVSQSFLDLVEMTLDEMRARGWIHRIPPGEVKPMLRRWLRCVKTGETWDSEHHVLGPDGRRHTVLTRGLPVRNEAGEITSWVGINLDIDDRKRAEEALKESEERFRSLFETSLDGILFTVPDGQILSANPAACRLFGRSEEELRAVGRAGVFDTDDPALAAALEERARTGRMRVELACMCQDGTRFLAEVTSVILEGAPARSFVIVRDITERKQIEQALRESERRYRFMAEASPQIVWTAEPDGLLDFFSGRLEEVTGHQPAEVMGVGWQDIVHPDELGPLTAAWEHSIATGESLEVEHRVRCADGAYRWFLSRALPLRDEAGAVVKWFGSSTDIHERKGMEEALREADRAKDRFMALLAHELRNPLSAAHLALQAMRLTSRSQATGDREVREYHQVIENQVTAMTHMVNDLLDLARIKQGKIALRPEWVALSSIVACAVETMRPLIEERHHRLEIDLPGEPVWFPGDPLRLGQVVSNLLNNAAKYMDPGGVITVSGETSERWVVLRVRDTGIGIAPEMVPRVFDQFAQVDFESRRSGGGLGLGLALVRQLVEMHGGTVTAESGGLGQGSTFTVRLPLGGASEQ